MTVTACHLNRPNKRLQVNDFDHVYQAQYQIHTDRTADEAVYVFYGAMYAQPDPLPGKRQTFDLDGVLDLNSQALQFNLEQDAQRSTLWKCDVTWRPPQPGDAEPPVGNPLLRPVRYWMEYSRETYTATHDYAGDEIRNNAKQPYPEPIIASRYVPILVIQRNYASFNAVRAMNATYWNTVNNDVFLGGAVFTWRYACTRCGEPREDNGIEYYIGTTRVEYNPDTWVYQKKEEGFKHLNNVLSQLVTPVDENNAPLVGEPVLLNAQGGRLGDTLDALFTEWRLDDDVPYAPLII